MLRRSLLLCLLLLPLLAACSPRVASVAAVGTTANVARAELPSSPSSGLASWYGPGFAGRLTANGEVFDPSEMTAAHKTLPFNTHVRVTNLENGRSVTVRINDRGPFKPGRVIDLSRAAAERIGMIGSGTASVRLELLSGVGGILPAAPHESLNRYEVIARGRRRGELLLLSAGGMSPVMVRVVGSTIAADRGAEILLSRQLFAELGDSVVIQASSASR